MASVVEFADEKGRPEFREVAVTTGGVDITRGYVRHTDLVPQPSEWLTCDMTSGMPIYDMTLSDPQVSAAFDQRQRALVGLEWEVVAGGEDRQSQRAADFIREALSGIPFDRFRKNFHYGVFYGFSVAEALYSRDGATVALEEIRVRDHRRFARTHGGELRMLTHSNHNGEEVPPRKFVVMTDGGTHDDMLYGVGLAHWLHWCVHFKRHIDKYWLIHLEKHGSPTAIGRFPAEWLRADGTLSQAARNLQAAISRGVSTNGSFSIPDNCTVELLHATIGATTHEDAIRRLDKAIAKKIIGQTLTLDDDGGQYKAEVHDGIRRSILKADADLIFGALNDTVIRWLVDWNFPRAVPPKAWPVMDEPEGLNSIVERDERLYAMGWERTEESARDTYGEGYERVKKQPVPPQLAPNVNAQNPDDSAEPDDAAANNAEFADRLPIESDAFDRAVDSIMGSGLTVDAREMIDSVMGDILSDEPRLALAKLGDIYAGMDSSRLEAMLARATYLAHTWGRISAANGR